VGSDAMLAHRAAAAGKARVGFRARRTAAGKTNTERSTHAAVFGRRRARRTPGSSPAAPGARSLRSL